MLRCFILLLFWGFSSPSTITLLPGSQFKLQCLPESDLMFTEYSWSFSNQLEEDKNKRIHFAPLGHTNEELELNPVEKRHAGTYKCVVRGTSAKGMMKVKRIFKISVIENPVFISWQLFEGDEGETITLSCSSSSKNVNSFDSAEVKWYKVKDTGDSFELKELKPVVRNQRNIKVEEIKPRQVYWASDLKQPDWSITIDSLELDDEDLYQCDIITGSEKESVLMELLVNAAPPPRCLNQSQPWEACPDIDSQSSEAILRESLTEFSLNLYKKINTMEPERNLLFSPISIAMVMSQLLLGTRGETRAELERGLFLPSEFSCVHSEMKKLSSRMKDSLLIANQMLFHPELKLREAFINQTQEFYDSVPQKLTNDSAANVKLINTWVADKTQNRVTELVDSLDSSVNIILLNAVYFIGKWKGTFEVKDQQQFTTLSMELLSVPALYSSNYYVATSYIQGLKAYVAKFTLTGKNSLYVLLPFEAGKNGLDIMEAKLTDKNVRNMVKEMASIIPVESEVLLPKVKLLVNTNLFILLKKLELPGLFSDPNLCGMIDQSSTMPLSDARHSAFLSLTEKGVEAAAASSVSFSRSFNNFHAMRPFVLMVFNEEVNIPLFTGKVLHPDKNE